MIAGTRRVIRRSSLTSAAEAAEVLRMVLLAEVVEPSPCMWLVSPWISDVAVLDNTTLAFAHLDGTWGAREVRLSEILDHRVRRGAGVVVATRESEPANQPFLEAIRRAGRAVLDEGLLKVVDDELLHEKGLASERFYLSGSLNITWNGIHVLGEKVELSTLAVDVQGAVRSFSERYGVAEAQPT